MRFLNRSKLLGMAGVLAALLLPASLAVRSARAQVTTFNYFPTGALPNGQLISSLANDGRFLALAGTGAQTLAGDTITVAFTAPVGAANFQVGIFDGDTGRTDSAGKAHWDFGTVPLEYSLYADPRGNATGRYLIGRWMGNGGNGTITGGMNTTAMPNNNWFNIPVATGPEARNPNGNYYYVLKVRHTAPTANSISSFKVRSDAVISILAQAVSLYAPLTTTDELALVTPTGQPTRYDGSWKINLTVPMNTSYIEVWDGDLDHGPASGVSPDRDDLDTPNTGVPPWAVGTAAVAEGAKGTGSPADDTTNTFSVRSPHIVYEVFKTDANGGPEGTVYANTNPSGNLEWERFLVTNDTNIPADHYFSGTLPAGNYQVRVRGMDHGNLNAFRFFHDAVGIGPDGDPVVKIPAGPVAGVLGDYVWLDSDQQGDQDEVRAGIAGVKLEVRDASGTLLDYIYTNLDGQYYYPVATAGNYTVTVSPDNFQPGGKLAGLANTTGGNSRTYAVATEDVLTYDFGFAPRVANSNLGDRVWLDGNGDGLQDSGEAGLPGVTVRLLDSGGNVVATQVTGADGLYLFTQLEAGSYTVAVEPTSAALAGLGQTFDLDGVGTAHTAAATLGVNATRLDVDFGYRALPAKLGDRVWLDSNLNGLQDEDEAGLGGVTVRLLDNGGGVVSTTTTDGSGLYLFDALVAGSYMVEFVTPSGYRLTAADQGGDDTLDSDAGVDGRSASVTLTAGQTDLGVDAGLYLLGSLGDTVWRDPNANGVQDSGEAGIAGILVRLLDGSGAIAGVTVTDGDGKYLFSDLGPGNYRVVVDPLSLPADATVQTYDLDGVGTAHEAAAALDAGQNRLDVDFGYKTAPAALGDRVWLDANNNGVQDSGETGVSGVTVRLLDGNGGVVAVTTTDDSGLYGFDGLQPGSYRVEFVPSGGAQFTTADQGSDLADSDVDPSTGRTGVISLAPGQTDLSVDAGIVGGEPAIALEKTAATVQVSPGQPVTYRYTVTNTGDVTLTDVTVTDDNATPAFGADDFVVGSVPSLAPGASTTLTKTVVPPLVMASADGTIAGVLIAEKLANGDVKATFIQSLAVVDNTYGTGSAPGYRGGSGKGHTFKDLVNSDHAEFRFTNAAGQVVLDFYVDCLSASSAAPSGYGTLGVSGGDGFMIKGSPAHVLSVRTSASDNLNQSPAYYGYTTNSPVGDPNWEARSIYSVVVSAAAFGASGFGTVASPDVHNSPAKIDTVNLTPAEQDVTNTAIVTARYGDETVTATDTATVSVSGTATSGGTTGDSTGGDTGSGGKGNGKGKKN